VGLERGPHGPVSAIEELLGRKCSGPVSKTEDTAVGIRYTDYAAPLYPQKLALTSRTSGGRSVGMGCSRNKATELFLPSKMNMLQTDITPREREALLIIL
jgi:hypothetical protein